LTDKAVSARKAPWLIFLLLAIANLAFLVLFADRDGYEGDDLNMVVPTAHLAAAKQGALMIYRYAWQPLSFELSSWLWSLFGTPTAVFLSMPVAGGLAIALFGWWLYREGQARTGAFARAIIALLCIPELWYSSLFYNTTMRAMPLIALALILVRMRGSLLLPLAAGVVTGFAVLMRLDFLLICPLLALAAWPKGENIMRPAVLAGGVVATVLAGFAAGLIDIPEILRINAFNSWEIKQHLGQPGWDFRLKAMVITVVLSPVGWLLLLVGGPLLLLDAVRRRDWRVAWWILAAIPPALPLPNILSPKYMLPLAPFGLLFFLRIQERIEEGLSKGLRIWAKRGLWAAAIIPVFLSVSLVGHAPFLVPGLSPVKPVPTHDGPRGWGGYAWQMMETDAPAAKPENQKVGEALAQALLTSPGENLVYLGGENYFDPGAPGWRHLQLTLEQRGIHGTLVAPHVLRFGLPNGHWLVLANTLPASLPGKNYKLIDTGPSAGPNDRIPTQADN
jgi:hypothetical protein